MKVLICGPSNSGSTRILRVVMYMAKSKNLKLNLIKEYQHEKSFDNDCDMHVYECNNFWKVYPSIKLFDVVILCVRDCRYVCHTLTEMMDYVQYIQCWNIFSSLTLKYEMYGPEQIMDISKLLHIPITYDDLISILEKVRIIQIKPHYSDVTCCGMDDNYLIKNYLVEHGYHDADPKTIKIPHSASF